MKLKTISVVAITSVLSLAGCKVESSPTSSEQGQEQQEAIMKRATNAVPTYQPTNFLSRKAVDKWMKRMDIPDKTFYIYLLGNNGSHIGYYVGQTRPISVCTLLTPPERLERADLGEWSGDMKMTAPTLDGVYGKGGCNSYFFFDAATDAYVEIQGLNFFVSDQPLSIDADPISVVTQ